LVSDQDLKVRVLLIDDSDILRRAIKMIIEGPTIEVCGESSSGTEALSMLGSLKPDVVVVDFFMPGMNGVEVVKLIRQSSTTAKIILLSVDDSGAGEALDAGADAFLIKDRISADLESTILRLTFAGRSDPSRARNS
jgi:DNA-binding NarL/FixJ family response regulator